MRVLSILLLALALTACSVVESGEPETILLQWRAPANCRAGYIQIEEEKDILIISPIIYCTKKSV
jgi:hypothetical protein